jgi:hypothetical protein
MKKRRLGGEVVYGSDGAADDVAERGEGRGR